jgi:MoaA/NifB/PqqE/SkfB family radical SAM enzyme
MSKDDILAALDGLYRLGMRAVSLDGSEPLVHEHIDTIVGWLSDRGVLLRINTNGVLIPRHQVAIMHMAKVKISLDGPGSVHDAVCGHGSFDRAVTTKPVAPHHAAPPQRYHSSPCRELVQP